MYTQKQNKKHCQESLDNSCKHALNLTYACSKDVNNCDWQFNEKGSNWRSKPSHVLASQEKSATDDQEYKTITTVSQAGPT